MNHEKAMYRQRFRRRCRVRKSIKGTAERPRLSIKRTHKHIYCQVIDDLSGRTIASASTVTAKIDAKHGGNKEAAAQVGKLIAERAKDAGIKALCFDRGAYRYHGRVAALADAVREAGVAV